MTIAESLVSALTRRKLWIACAESCTGGLLSAAITAIPGASAVFSYGVITYSNEAKKQILGVDPVTLQRYGAVSSFTATEMARGIRRLSNADIGLGITGIAGPGGGSEQKPVGLVYIGCSYQTEMQVRRFQFLGTRDVVRNQTVDAALTLALDMMKRGEQ